MNSQEIINLQDNGLCKERLQAGQAVNAACSKTPEAYRHLFRSVIRFTHDGYEWWWILK